MTALILDRLGLANDVINGATDTSGHSWLALPDGNWLDPTWELYERPTDDGTASSEWKHFSHSYVYESQSYPYLILGY